MAGSGANGVGPTGLQALRRELGAPPPEGLSALSEDDLSTLIAAVAEIRAEQRHALAAAGEAAFGHIPALLRRPIRKLLGT